MKPFDEQTEGKINNYYIIIGIYCKQVKKTYECVAHPICQIQGKHNQKSKTGVPETA